MELMSNKAQVILEEELESYKNKLVNRALQYTESDGDALIREKQIIAAIRDYGNLDLASVQNNQRKQRARYIMVTMWLVVFVLLIWFSVSIIYLAKDTPEYLVFVLGLTTSAASLFAILSLYLEMRKWKNMKKSESVVGFLEKWNEFESLLRYTYKGPNKGGNVPFTDLIEYYLDSVSEDKEADERLIVSNLRMRNNIIHRSISQANESMLERNKSELDRLIKKVKGLSR